MVLLEEAKTYIMYLGRRRRINDVFTFLQFAGVAEAMLSPRTTSPDGIDPDLSNSNIQRSLSPDPLGRLLADASNHLAGADSVEGSTHRRVRFNVRNPTDVQVRLSLLPCLNAISVYVLTVLKAIAGAGRCFSCARNCAGNLRLGRSQQQL